MSKSNDKIMPWVDALLNVQSTDFQVRRDQIEAMIAEADELVKQAEELRGRAYFATLKLEACAKGKWSLQVVEQAKRSVGC